MKEEYHDRLPPDDAKTPEQAILKIRFEELERIYVFGRKRQICNFIGEVDRVNIEPKYLFELKDAILVHNHPYGTSFSKEDVIMTIVHDAKQLIVVTSDFLYSITRPNNGWPAELDEQTISIKFKMFERKAQEMANKLISQHQIRSTEQYATIIHYIWVLFFYETDIYAKKELPS